jgi:hypothetical protein
MKKTILTPLLAIWLASQAQVGRADSPNPETVARAQQLYERGVSAYDEGEYDRAIRAFEESYRLIQEPLLLFNIGQAYRLMGNCEKALDYYQRYRSRVGEKEPVPGYARAVSKCEEALSRAAAIEQAVKEDAGSSETALSPATPPGGAKRSGEDGGSAGGETLRWAGLGLGACGLIGAGVGTALSLRASSARRDLEAHQGEWTPELDRRLSAQNRDRVLGPALLSAGAIAIAGGAALYLLSGAKGDQGGGLAIGVGPTGQGALLSWSGRD